MVNGYKDFVADLQHGIRDDLYERPTKAVAEYFIGKMLTIDHIDCKMFVAKLQYTITTGEQGSSWNSEKLKSGAGFLAEKTHTFTLERSEGCLVKYDLVGRIADGSYDANIFTAEKNTDFSKAYRAKKLFKKLSGEAVVYESVDSYQHLLDIMESL